MNNNIVDMTADRIFYYYGGFAITLIVSLLLIFLKTKVPQSYTIPIAIASGVFIIIPTIMFIILSKRSDKEPSSDTLLKIWSIIIIVFGTIFKILILLAFSIIYIIYCMGTKTKPSFNPLASTKVSKSPKSSEPTETTTPIETPKPTKYYCKYCGSSNSTIRSLTGGSCKRSPSGHCAPYEGDEKSKYYCMYCGSSNSTIRSLTGSSCKRSPNGHCVPYEGDEKSKYYCMYCGSSNSSIRSLTGSSCKKNPNGENHVPAK